MDRLINSQSPKNVQSTYRLVVVEPPPHFAAILWSCVDLYGSGFIEMPDTSM